MKGSAGWTPLHWAAYNGDVKLIEGLLAKGECLTEYTQNNPELIDNKRNIPATILISLVLDLCQVKIVFLNEPGVNLSCPWCCKF